MDESEQRRESAGLRLSRRFHVYITTKNNYQALSCRFSSLVETILEMEPRHDSVIKRSVHLSSRTMTRTMDSKVNGSNLLREILRILIPGVAHRHPPRRSGQPTPRETFGVVSSRSQYGRSGWGKGACGYMRGKMQWQRKLAGTLAIYIADECGPVSGSLVRIYIAGRSIVTTINIATRSPKNATSKGTAYSSFVT